MSMLSFLFKDKGDTVEHAPAHARVMPPAPATTPAPAPETSPPTDEEDLDFDEIRNALDQIAEVLGRGDGYDMLKVTAGDVTAVEIKLSDLMDVAGHVFSSHTPSPADEDRKASVLIEDIFGQLGHGRIATTVGNLVADVPGEYLASNINEMRDSEVVLPLPMIVGSISPDELMKRTTHVERQSGVQDLPNLFTPGSAAARPAGPEDEPAVTETVEAQAAEEPDMVEEATEPTATVEEVETPIFARAADEETVELTAADTIDETAGLETMDETVADEAHVLVEEEIPVRAEEPAEDPPAATSPETWAAPSEEPEPERVALSFPTPALEEAPAERAAAASAHEHVLVLRGLDLNTATADELIARLDGVGAKLAHRIVHNRETKGPFLDLLDLARVPGLGRKTFRKITGMRWPEGEEALPETRSNVLSFSSDGYLNVKDVAARFSALPGFQGCVVAHQDGYVLASGWANKADQALGAFAPQIFKKVERYVRRLNMGPLDCMTVILDQCPITFVPSQDIYFVAIHKIGGISRKHVRLAHGVGCRLGRLLKGRAQAA